MYTKYNYQKAEVFFVTSVMNWKKSQRNLEVILELIAI